MLEVVEAIYKDGVFVPEKAFSFNEGERVNIVVETLIQKNNAENFVEENADSNPFVQEPVITDPEERKKVLAQLFKRWDENPIPVDAPRKFTREELHERR